jgi:hypothetical protein
MLKRNTETVTTTEEEGADAVETRRPSPSPLPGFVPLEQWCGDTGISIFTGLRWEGQGRLVIFRQGRKRFVDTVRTARVWRGEVPRRRGRPPKRG